MPPDPANEIENEAGLAKAAVGQLPLAAILSGGGLTVTVQVKVAGAEFTLSFSVTVNGNVCCPVT